jgi:hypothetical protein
MKNDINNLNVFIGKSQNIKTLSPTFQVSACSPFSFADEVLYIMIQYFDRLQFARGDKNENVRVR